MAETTAQSQGKELKKFGFIDQLAYGLGDFGCNMSFALKSYLTIFWTQFMGIDSYMMAFLLLIVQIWDAINDPLLGMIVDADRHEYKRNKFVQYVWAGSIGLLVAGALCYIPWTTAPYVVKCILFCAGYMFWDAFYTVANVPYGSLLSLITADPAERTKLSTARSVGSMAGSMSASIIIPFLIYDASNNLRGDTLWVIGIVMGVLGFIAFQFMIKNTVVRVENKNLKVSDDEPVKFNPFVGIGHFLRNRAAIGATIAPVGQFIGMYGAATSVQVLFQAYFQNAQVSGIFSMLSYFGLFLWMPFAAKIVAKYGKKEVLIVGSIITCIGYALILILPITPDTTGLTLYAVAMVVAAIGGGIGSCVSWSLMADAMDYEEWKFGTRNEGTTYAMHSFFRKLAQGIGPSVGLAVATYLGYEATLGAAQPEAVQSAMLMQTGVFYLISGLCQFIGYAFVYNLDKNTVAQMEHDLAIKHGTAETEEVISGPTVEDTPPADA